MNWFDMVKRYYDAGAYNNDPTSDMYVGKFVANGKITEEQYTEITGTEYVPPQPK